MNLRNLLLAIIFIASAGAAQAQTALVTFINASADTSLSVVDIWVYQSGLLNKVEDVPFKGTTNFDQFAIYADLDVTFSVAAGNSSDVSQAFASRTFMPIADAGYIVVLSGVRNTAGFAPNPDARPIAVSVMERRVPVFGGQPNQIGMLFAHAATDLEKCDVYARGTTAPAAAGLTYSDITTSLVATARDRVFIDFTKAGVKTQVLASFEVDIAAFQSETVVFVLAGYKTPADNNHSQQALILLALLENGTVVSHDLIAGSQKARVQWVHNAPDASLGAIDVWIDSVKTLDNFVFRKATPYMDIAAGAPIRVAFATATSTSYRDTIKTVVLPALRPGRVYNLMIAGVVDTTKFAKNPNMQDLTLRVISYEAAMEKSDTTGKTAVRSSHTAPDQAGISIRSANAIKDPNNATQYATGLSFGGVSSNYVYITPVTDTLWVYIDSTNKPFKGYVADLKGTDKSTHVVASGFVNPAANNNGPAFRLILVDANGNSNATMTEVMPDTGTSVVEEDLVPATLWRIAPNPATDRFTVEIPLTSTLVSAHGMLLNANVYTMQGMMLGMYPMTVNGLTATVTIPTASVAVGSYQVYVTTAGGVHVGSATIVVTR